MANIFCLKDIFVILLHVKKKKKLLTLAYQCWIFFGQGGIFIILLFIKKFKVKNTFK